jgi:hypothetical protein
VASVGTVTEETVKGGHERFRLVSIRRRRRAAGLPPPPGRGTFVDFVAIGSTAMGRRGRVVAALSGLALLAGCGGGGEAARSTASAPTSTANAPTATAPAPRARRGQPVPPALRTAESASEDTIDLALAGKRRRVVAKAHALKAVADGPAGPALRAAGVSAREIAEFRARAGEVARLAPSADLLQVALAANRTFALVAGFFAHYDTRVPALVTSLDHFDFEAKLQAEAGGGAALRAAVQGLHRTWSRLRPDVVKAGGGHVVSRFDAHVARMDRLAARGGRAAVREAQHGLDLVDEVEAVYNR